MKFGLTLALAICCATAISAVKINLLTFENIVYIYAVNVMPAFARTEKSLVTLINSFQKSKNNTELYALPKILDTFVPLYTTGSQQMKILKSSLEGLIGKKSGVGPRINLPLAFVVKLNNAFGQISHSQKDVVSQVTLLKAFIVSILQNATISHHKTLKIPFDEITKIYATLNQLTNSNKEIAGGFNTLVDLEMENLSSLEFSLENGRTFLDAFFMAMGSIGVNYQNNALAVSKLANLLLLDGTLNTKTNVMNLNLPRLYHQINVALQKLAALCGNAARDLKIMKSNLVNPQNQVIEVA